MNEQRINILFEKEYLGIKYKVIINKPKNLFISVYLSDLIFFSNLKNERSRKIELQKIRNHFGKITDKDKETLKQIQVINIIKPQEETLFNYEVQEVKK